MTYTLEPNEMECPRCEGLGLTYDAVMTLRLWERITLKYEHPFDPDLDEMLDYCDECNGSGAIEIEEDE